METILLVDDEPGVLAGQRNLLEINGYTSIRTAEDLESARQILASEQIALVLLDLTLEHASGMRLLEEIQRDFPTTVVVVVTGTTDLTTAVSCMRAGAYDFLVKGSDTGRIPSMVKNALEHRRISTENTLLKAAFTSTQPHHPQAFSQFLTQDDHLRRVLVYLQSVAELPDPVLITGETGVGKELIARGVHEQSGRTGDFVPVNLGGVDDHVFTDTLFGHHKGAFTGAEGKRHGLVAKAAEGTLFLDEIGEMPLESQSRLLRLLDTGEYLPLGVDEPLISRARIVCATNRDLKRAVEDGRFRRDLYFRISVHHVTIPPLRDRPGDISLIAAKVLQREASRLGRKPLPFTDAVARQLTSLTLPGNVRELYQIVLKALLMDDWSGVPTTEESPTVGTEDGGESATVATPEASESPQQRVTLGVLFGDELPTPDTLIDLLLQEADRRNPTSRTEAAQSIGLSPQAFANRWKRMEERHGHEEP
jgi:DNA-binding NtrC family response regulator